jgi:mannose-6-phosphate isomerase-like protein (cupin superfamily)
MSHFQNLRQIVDSLEVDESTKDDPIKRVFVIDGKHMTANVGVMRDSENALHTQMDHDELLVIIDGGVRFRVGDEISQVQAGDLVFIPQGTLHGPELQPGERFSSLSVFAPVFDRTKSNIIWDRDDAD